MSPKWCPGSMLLRQPKPELFKCPDCGAEVEIWSDEATRPCPSCGKNVFRIGGGQSCLDWCRLAKECVGEDKYKEYGKMKADLRKHALIRAMEDYFGDDGKRIQHARKVIGYAELILAEEQADPNVVLAAAALHDIGIRNAEEKHGSSAARYQEKEGPPVAERILQELEYPSEFISEVCDIIGHHHHPRTEETMNFKVLYDADLLVNSEEARSNTSSATNEKQTLRFFTGAAADLARKRSS